VDDIFGGSIPRQFVPAVEKGIQDARTRGYLAGFPMVDFRVTVFDGSYHDVDSNELSFRLAGSLAFKDAMTRARPTILEPIMNVEVYAPSDFAGDLMGDLNGRRGRIAGMDTRGVMTIIKAIVPMSEMLTYEQHLTSATGGRGTYHMSTRTTTKSRLTFRPRSSPWRRPSAREWRSRRSRILRPCAASSTCATRPGTAWAPPACRRPSSCRGAARRPRAACRQRPWLSAWRPQRLRRRLSRWD